MFLWTFELMIWLLVSDSCWSLGPASSCRNVVPQVAAANSLGLLGSGPWTLPFDHSTAAKFSDRFSFSFPFTSLHYFIRDCTLKTILLWLHTKNFFFTSLHYLGGKYFCQKKRWMRLRRCLFLQCIRRIRPFAVRYMLLISLRFLSKQKQTYTILYFTS